MLVDHLHMIIKRNIRLHTLLLLLGASLFVGGCSAIGGTPKFDGARAFDSLVKQCDFGPRAIGMESHASTRDYLATELRKTTRSVELQTFQHKYGGRTYELSNVIAKFGASDKPGILLCAHWDTRPTADQELDRVDQKKPILGANDGASGVAVLLELARMFSENPPAVPVTIVLLDGEDFGQTESEMFLGARYFAGSIKDKSEYKYGILLDMIGDKDLQIYREANSQRSAESIVDKVWNSARKLGYAAAFKDSVKYTIGDDHLSLIDAGVPCIDVIDFDYAYWHTLDDTVNKCSAESLKIVGETIGQVVYSERP